MCKPVGVSPFAPTGRNAEPVSGSGERVYLCLYPRLAVPPLTPQIFIEQLPCVSLGLGPRKTAAGPTEAWAFAGRQVTSRTKGQVFLYIRRWRNWAAGGGVGRPGGGGQVSPREKLPPRRLGRREGVTAGARTSVCTQGELGRRGVEPEPRRSHRGRDRLSFAGSGVGSPPCCRGGRDGLPLARTATTVIRTVKQRPFTGLPHCRGTVLALVSSSR